MKDSSQESGIIELDFTELNKKEKEAKARDKAREEYTKQARESGYIKRKRKELRGKTT